MGFLLFEQIPRPCWPVVYTWTGEDLENAQYKRHGSLGILKVKVEVNQVGFEKLQWHWVFGYAFYSEQESK